MFKNKKMLLGIGAAALVVILGVVIALVALQGMGGNSTNGETATYNIEVKSASGIPLKDVGLYIYEDSTLTELVSFLKTDDAGKTSFTDVAKDTYVAVLDKVPTGYTAEAYYPITGELTEIVLQTGKMEDADLENLTYKLGDAMMDFSVIGPDGTEYTLSGLFEGKQAVVLNFFYNNCQPCMLEFPFLQEAYAEYSDRIAVLAMNPVDGDDASIAALQKELGITFPMVKCGPEWEKIMQIKAYPTTVIIDRFGNICLIHAGSVTDAKIFKDAFAHFTAEDYEQKLIENIEDLLVEAPEGSKENPTEIGGQTSFEVTVEPGQVMYTELYKVFDMYLQIQSENAYVIYNGETYYPKNGVVGLMVSSPDTFTPAVIGIGNSGTKTETFKVYMSALKGTFDNPYALSLGDFTVNIQAGNDQGVFYTYTPTEDGTLTLQCLSATSGVKYGYYLFNTETSAMRNLESDSVTDETGAVTVSVAAKKGQKIQVCVSTLPDGNNSYPAAEFKFRAVFTPGEVKDAEKVQMTDFSVKVVDDENTPLANVSLVVNVDGEQTGFATEADGVAIVRLPSGGSYTGSIYVPDGYTADNVSFVLTESAPNVTITVKKIRMVDYKVRVLNPAEEAVANVYVKIGDSAWQRTDANGTAVQNLVEGTHSVTIIVPDAYSGETEYTFAEGEQELVIRLGHPVGSQENPARIESYPFTTGNMEKDGEYYCYVSCLEDMLGVSIADADAYIRWENSTCGPDANGVVRFNFTSGMESPVLLIIGNSGDTAEKYTLQAEYPWGTEKYPEQVSQTGDQIQRTLESGDADGYYLQYAAQTSGVLTVQVTNTPAVPYEITLSTDTVQTKLSESDVPGRVTIGMAAGETAKIHVQALPDPITNEYPELMVELDISFTGNGENPNPPENQTGIYSVTVTDAFGAMQSGVSVIFMKDGVPVESVTTDDNGVAQMSEASSGIYTAELFFNGTSYYYDKTAAVMTDSNRSITLKLYAHLDESRSQEIYILNGNPAYLLEEGGTHVQIGSGRPNFSAEYGNNCFFVFAPEIAGTYQITSGTPGVELSFWGATTFINKQYASSEEGRNNAITESISGTSVGNVTYVIGVSCAEGVTDVVLNVARIGDPEFSIADQPWHEWQSGLTHSDAWLNEVGMTPVKSGEEILYYTLSANATYLDMNAASGTYNLYYDAANGYYRLYQGGPIVLVNLNAANRFVSLYERVNGNGQYGGSAVTEYFFDATGAFVRKENYTEYLAQCFAGVYLDSNSETGYYPLTKDLMHVLQNGFCDWWDAESPNYLEGFASVNKEYAWMFACCYVSK